MINICIFEDSRYKDLQPLTYMDPLYSSLLGDSTLAEKLISLFPYSNITLHCRDYLEKRVKAIYRPLLVNRITGGAPCLFVNGRVLANQALDDCIQRIDKKNNVMITQDGTVALLYLHADKVSYFRELLKRIPDASMIISYFREKVVAKEADELQVINKLSDLVKYNSDAIRYGFERRNMPGIIKGKVGTLSTLTAENQIFVDQNTEIENYVTLDASEGPIIIEKDVKILAQTTIRGPVFIGEGTTIREGSCIRSTSIGPHCKIGGEVSCSIFNSYSNKAHDGFVGHSYIGSWVNLGAGTTMSNLKNNYNPIKLHTASGTVDTGEQFLGSFIGGHSKTAIGTRLNAGTVLGFGSSIIGNALHHRWIPEFSWGESGQYQRHDYAKFINTATKMMERRGQSLARNDVELLQLLHDQSCSTPTKKTTNIEV